ncbi:hypothetical protein AK830_g2460 [Neonectria ditissima]|uniref:Uncharacterized protein n=1 Tax=Neonectria ditissima TaxID=78410 RepID=A0A0P7BF29_9HYPO|nr:hypothetical protein AK830_g2460 [Neonectria ditissima]
MIVRDIKRLSLFTGSILFLVYVGFCLYASPVIAPTLESAWDEPPLAEPKAPVDDLDQLQEEELSPSSTLDVAEVPATPTPISNSDDVLVTADVLESADVLETADVTASDAVVSPTSDDLHQEVFSLSTKDTKFFLIDFGGVKAMNPNILPHPTLENTWIIVAQQVKEISTFFAEITCNAIFQDDVLRCLHPPTPLPIAATAGDRCEGDLAYMNQIAGPHDARVFFGPDDPYIVFGSNSIFTCYGQFIQDFRMLLEWGTEVAVPTDFRLGTELQRPLPWSIMEKNWFPFWDTAGQMYIHYDIAPKRVFSQISPDGFAGPDLAPFAASSDEKCLSKYLPQLPPEFESIHQATNSLQITMCRKEDPSCVTDESNTFIFTIVQHKSYYHYHGVYEPYVVVFQQRAPFEIYAISQKPVWIHGREKHADRDTSDMFYVTSMSWKNRNNKYHGYLDDELFLAFGVEDEKAAGIDLLAWDLLQNLGLCLELQSEAL